MTVSTKTLSRKNYW